MKIADNDPSMAQDAYTRQISPSLELSDNTSQDNVQGNSNIGTGIRL